MTTYTKEDIEKAVENVRHVIRIGSLPFYTGAFEVLIAAYEAAEKDALILNNWLAEGRPHGSNTYAYPDGCDCELCQLYDSFKAQQNKKEV